MGRSHRKYSREFKVSAVRLVVEQGYTVVEAAKSLGVDDKTIRDWMAKFQGEVGPPASGEAALKEQVRRLREENARLLMEREILKKAAAFFAKNQA
jgi:transposase